MMTFITDYIEVYILLLTLLVIVFIIAFIIMTRRYSKLRQSYNMMLDGTNVPDFEKVMIQVHAKLAEIQADQSLDKKRIEGIVASLKTMKSNIGIHRYNAFDQQGNDQSFSLAIINEYQTGMILTGLHNREDSYIYAKPLDKG